MKKEELERIYIKLCDMGEIRYGHSISSKTLSKLFGVEEDELWSCRLTLKGYLEEKEGMFCKIDQGDLNIGKLNDTSEHSKRRRKRADNLDKRTRKILENIDYREMSSSARSEAMLEKRLLDLKLRNSRLIMREIEYYEISEEEIEDEEE